MIVNNFHGELQTSHAHGQMRLKWEVSPGRECAVKDVQVKPFKRQDRFENWYRITCNFDVSNSEIIVLFIVAFAELSSCPL